MGPELASFSHRDELPFSVFVRTDRENHQYHFNIRPLVAKSLAPSIINADYEELQNAKWYLLDAHKDLISTPSNEQLWKNDSIEVYVNFKDTPSCGAKEYRTNDHVFVLGLRGENASCDLIRLHDGKAIIPTTNYEYFIQRKNNVAVYKLLIPFSCLPAFTKSTKTFDFALKINNRDNVALQPEITVRRVIASTHETPCGRPDK